MEVAARAVVQFNSKTKKLNSESIEARRVLISICFELWKSNKKRIARGQPSSQLIEFGQLPEQMPAGADQTAWLRFHKDAGDEELLALLFTQILRFPENEISDALKISTGTLRHRVARGIRMLGDYVGSPSL